ncbi:MAG: hypothetical protein JJU09_15080 [Rhodobacteraceae bacterium]|nr:hypothetical protein [Paracoccaceae bacterium]TVR46202.1 MAG: hypothetical protein EA386_10550 [Paracoccaceae bacterium]
MMERLRAERLKRRKLKQRHGAALREIDFLRARLQAHEQHGPQPPILPPPGSLRPELQPRAGRATLWKTARTRLLWSGLTADQALYLECTCLQRLARETGRARSHFPQIITIRPADHCFEITHQGPTVREMVQAGSRVPVPDPEAQVSRIVDQMRASGVVHLDMLADGRNLCVSADGHVSVIDFDIASVDGVAYSGMIERHLTRFHESGGHDGYASLLLKILQQVRA